MQKISDDQLRLNLIWSALGIARDSYAHALTLGKYPDLAGFYLSQRDGMQVVRDEIEERMERLRELEELDSRWLRGFQKRLGAAGMEYCFS